MQNPDYCVKGMKLVHVGEGIKDACSMCQAPIRYDYCWSNGEFPKICFDCFPDFHLEEMLVEEKQASQDHYPTFAGVDREKVFSIMNQTNFTYIDGHV